MGYKVLYDNQLLFDPYTNDRITDTKLSFKLHHILISLLLLRILYIPRSLNEQEKFESISIILFCLRARSLK